MLKLFQPKHPSILGLDISTSSISLLGISGSDQELYLEGYAREMLPPHVLDGGLIKDLDSLAFGIKKIHKDSGLTTKEVAFALPDYRIIKHFMQLPPGLSDLEMEELILIEMEGLLSYPAEKISFDFEILGGCANNPDLLEVSILATRTEYLAEPVEALTRAGLKPKIVDVHSQAVERAIRHIWKKGFSEYQAKILALVHIGKRHSQLFVFHEGRLIYSGEEQGSSIQVSDQGVFLEQMVAKIKAQLRCFYSSNPQFQVDIILLAGEAVRPDLDVFIQEQLKIGTVIANPFRGMSVNSRVKTDCLHQDAPALMVACGLALRSITFCHERH